MTLGFVSKHQVPMIMTFTESDVEIICDSLAYSLEEAYKIIDFFGFPHDDSDPFEEE